MLGAFESRTGLGFGAFVRALRTRIILRDCALIFAEHVDAEPLPGVKMRVRAGIVVDADQYQ